MSIAFRNWSFLRQRAGAGRTTPSSAGAARASRAAVCLVRFLICYLLPVWCCIVAAAATASAATTASGTSDVPQESAPMCDPDGASVAAPEDIPEVDRGRFEALPCEAQLLLTGWRPDMPEVGRKAVSCHDTEPAPVQAPPPPHRFEGARAFTVSFPVRPEPLNTEFGEVNVLAYRRGHERGLFRPPVAR